MVDTPSTQDSRLPPACKSHWQSSTTLLFTKTRRRSRLEQGLLGWKCTRTSSPRVSTLLVVDPVPLEFLDIPLEEVSAMCPSGMYGKPENHDRIFFQDKSIWARGGHCYGIRASFTNWRSKDSDGEGRGSLVCAQGTPGAPTKAAYMLTLISTQGRIQQLREFNKVVY